MFVSCLLVAVFACLAHGREDIVNKEIKAGCTLNLNTDFNLPYPEPLLLQKDGNKDGLSFHLPKNNSAIIELTSGDVVRIGCTGGFDDNYFFWVGPGVREVNAICISGDMFTVEDRYFRFQDLMCRVDAYETTTRLTTKCNNVSSLLEIGFKVRVDFINIMDICFDDATKNTLWSKYQLVGGIEGRQKDRTGNAPFLADSYYPDMDMDNLYSREGQRKTLAKILGSYEQVDQFINSTTGNFFLSRGHLTARADFVYFSQHIATYHYINVAPQWQTFNGGNWEKIENSLRQFVNDTHVNLDVYTGTHGITTLPDMNHVERELWLYLDENNNKGLPVPRLYWKVVYDPASKRGVALLGVNNPHVSDPGNDSKYKICNDVSSQINWLSLPSAYNVTLGYSYCCEVNDFRNNVKSLPAFDVTGLLTG